MCVAGRVWGGERSRAVTDSSSGSDSGSGDGDSDCGGGGSTSNGPMSGMLNTSLQMKTNSTNSTNSP